MGFCGIVNLNESFEIYGLKTRTKNIDEMSGGSKITSLWSEFLNLKNVKIDETYAVYSEYESDFNSFYTIFLGTKTPQIGLKKAYIKSGKFALFSKDKNNKGITIELWREIWEFFENSNLKRAYETDFEKYLKDKIEIYISIK